MKSIIGESFILVKPDAIEKGLTDKIRRHIIESGLSIEMEFEFEFSIDSARTFYDEYKDREYFLELTEFISSRAVFIFLVKGEDVVKKTRLIIGKRYPPSGLREMYAESIIRNVAHAPDSTQAAERELKIIKRRT